MRVDIYNTDKKYNIIYADPPWAYKDKRTDSKISGGATSHYNTMKTSELEEMAQTIQKYQQKIVCYLCGQHFQI